MTTIHYSSNYLSQRKKYLRNNSRLAETVIAKIKLFVQNPRHPSLNSEKLKGSNVWTIRISRGDRIFFYWTTNSEALFIDIGPHDKYRQY